jgi:deoxyribonuclease V
MILAVDVQYYDDYAIVAGVLFENWDSEVAKQEVTCRLESSEYGEYVPGEFYKRELPCIEKVIDAFGFCPEVIVIDGYVDLGEKPGLGRYLYDAHSGMAEVVGVAKSRFINDDGFALSRGDARPIYITSTGNMFDNEEAAELVASMAGPFRMPTLLKRADTLARSV